MPDTEDTLFLPACTIYIRVYQWHMGNGPSVMDMALARVAFEPPPCSYAATGRKIVRTVDGDDVCMQLCAPFSVVHREVPSSLEAYEPGKPCVLFSHGNAEDLGQTRSFTQAFADEHDCNVLSYDYVGYGLSSAGTPTESNMKSAIEAVFQFATMDLKIPHRDIVLMGRSIGTAPTIFLASQLYCDVRGTILISPLASGFRTMVTPQRVGVRLCTVLDALFCPSIVYIRNVQAPVCIVHGQKDTVIALHNAEELQAAVPTRWKRAPLYVHGAGHNDILSKYHAAAMQHVSEFLRSCQPAGEPYD
jgi:pimeloyl-ACP methyl ester carboxylesterase